MRAWNPFKHIRSHGGRIHNTHTHAHIDVFLSHTGVYLLKWFRERLDCVQMFSYERFYSNVSVHFGG